MNLIIILLCCIGSSLAGDLSYLQPGSIDVTVLRPEGPSLNVVLTYQNTRTKVECDRASVEARGFADSFFGPPYGPLSEAEADKLIEFQEKLFKEVKYFSKILKNLYQVKRPYVLSSEVTPCIPPENSFSFPSGHAAVAVVAAKSFALLYPERSDELLARAIIIGDDRVLGGVHYPEDVEAGRVLGQMIFNELRNNENFINDLRKLKE